MTTTKKQITKKEMIEALINNIYACNPEITFGEIRTERQRYKEMSFLQVQNIFIMNCG